MEIYMTGASGFVGGAIARTLVERGHDVAALSRSAEADKRLRALGVRPQDGDLADLERPRATAASADAVVHAAIDYGDPDFGRLDVPAVRAFCDAAPRVIYLSSTLVYGDTGDEPATEERVPAPLVQAFKLDSERATLAAGGTVIRAGLAYGYDGSALIDQMRTGATQGVVTHVGDGRNRWSLVHADDLAELVCLVVEQHAAAGQVLNAAGAEAPSMRELAEAVAGTAGAAVAPVPVAQAAEMMGDFADQLTRNLVADSTRAQDLTGWIPRAPRLAEALHAQGSISPRRIA